MAVYKGPEVGTVVLLEDLMGGQCAWSTVSKGAGGKRLTEEVCRNQILKVRSLDLILSAMGSQRRVLSR